MTKNKYTKSSGMMDDMREHALDDRKVPEAGLKAARAKSKTAIKGNPKAPKATPKEDHSAGAAAATAKTRKVKKGY